MRVQITKCSDKADWYYDKVGVNFLVEEHPRNKHLYILENDMYNSILKSDCIILNEDDHMPRHIREVEETPGGSTPSQYQLPDNAMDLQDLIEYRDMNFSMGNIFKACYRNGKCSHSDSIRDMNKIIWFANRELNRLTNN